MIALTRVAEGGGGFGPLNVDDVSSLWSMIDLRPGGLGEGWCLYGGQEVPRGALILGEPGERSQAAVNILRNRLGVNLDSRTLGEEILSLLVEHGRTDGKGWRPLRPARRKYEVWLGGELVAEMPAVSGGAVFASDDFNRADGALGSDWPVTSGTQQIDTNRLYSNMGVALHTLEAPTLDYYAQVDYVAKPPSLNPDSGTVVRVDYATSENAYYGTWRNTGRAALIRLDGDLTGGVPTNTTLGFVLYSTGETLPRTMETSAIGSTIRFRILNPSGGVEANVSATDTTYPNGRGHGVYTLPGGDAGDIAYLDNYEAGDFTTWHTGFVGAG